MPGTLIVKKLASIPTASPEPDERKMTEEADPEFNPYEKQLTLKMESHSFLIKNSNEDSTSNANPQIPAEEHSFSRNHE